MATQSDTPDTTHADEYLALWESDQPPELAKFVDGKTEISAQDLSDIVLIDQARRWQSGGAPSAEEYLNRFPRIADNPDHLLDVVYGEYRARLKSDAPETPKALLARFPTLADRLATQFEVANLVDTSVGMETAAGANPPGQHSAAGTSGDVTREDLAPLSLDDYRLEEQLGAGAMGKVYRATQISLGKRVAVKLLNPKTLPPEALAERFLFEARAVAQLAHPNIVDVHGIGRDGQGRLFLVMDLIDGVDLASRIADGPLPIPEAVQIVAKAARAVDHAHGRGVIHRDLKPANVMLDADGNVLVTDFGLAKQLQQPSPAMSSPGDVIGTPDYMAPEQADPRLGEIGPRTDVYALGGLLYALLTGDPPNRGISSLEVLSRLVTGDNDQELRVIRSETPAGVEAICLKCLRHDPTQRFATAREVEEALLGQAASLGGDASDRIGGPTLLRRNGRLWGAVAAIGLCSMLCLGFLAFRHFNQGRSEGVTKGANQQEDRSVETADDLHAVEVKWQLDVFQDGRRDARSRITQLSRSLTTGDSIRVQLDFSEPVFAYVFWIGGDGSIQELYPKSQTPAGAIRRVVIPTSHREGLPVQGEPGTEVCVVLLRQSPKPVRVNLLKELLPTRRFPTVSAGTVVIDGRRIVQTKPGDGGVAAAAPEANEEPPPELLELLNADSRTLGEAKPLVQDAFTTAIADWQAPFDVDLGVVHYLAIAHVKPNQ